jgi:hypothetical protein
LGFRHAGHKAPQRVVTDHTLQAEQFVERGVFAQTLHMDKTTPVAQKVQAEAGQHVIHRRGVGAGAGDRTGGGQRFEQTALLLESGPRHQSAEGRERVVGGTKPDVATIGGEGENRFTRRVKDRLARRVHARDLAATTCPRNPTFATRYTAESRFKSAKRNFFGEVAKH